MSATPRSWSYLYPLLALIFFLLAGLSSAQESDLTAHGRAFDLPPSAYFSEETLMALKHQHAFWARPQSKCPDFDSAPKDALGQVRQCEADEFYQSAAYLKIRNRFPVKVERADFAGVRTEVFTPAAGIGVAQKGRVLINLHGGGFLEGARTVSQLESIPIASVGKLKVISIDYRQAPEFRFPAASDDVVRVYKELLRSYSPQNIGIYGCSAGGLLTAETVAALLSQHLPLPGAIGMFCMGASYVNMGDSSIIAHVIDGTPFDEFAKYQQYFEGVSREDPRAFPVRDAKILARFPPVLMISATRDHALSSVLDTHTHLTNLKVPADLHVFEGLGHGFFYNPEIPESRQVYDIVTRFFDDHLGKSARQGLTANP